MFTVNVVMFLPFIQMRREQALNIASGNVPTFHTDEEGTDSEHS